MYQLQRLGSIVVEYPVIALLRAGLGDDAAAARSAFISSWHKRHAADVPMCLRDSARVQMRCSNMPELALIDAI
jgi:hypothetical protein